MLSQNDLDFVLKKHPGIQYPTFINDTFKEIYYTEEENQWIDMVITNINLFENVFKKALSLYALIQSCISKRPFNLFHRKNLYLRFSEVERSFGNKNTWDTPFETHFKKFAVEVNSAVFSNGQHNKALNVDVFDITGEFDLVYIDTPYVSSKGIGVDYLGFYHFLEGLVDYSHWDTRIDWRSKHRRLIGNGSVWIDKKRIHSAFHKLFKKFNKSIIVVSYRADGIPSPKELVTILKIYKNDVRELERKQYKYVLSNNHSEEILLIGI